ncbi:MAG TPA: alpha/beta hydrolase [Ktedonobacteraceae bacterium]|nr:alpha/beta hydrolase [Ktedonobacteraceae bacterium]
MGIEYNEGKQSTEGSLGFIHRFLLPAENDTTHVTLLLLHGTGGDENDLIDLGRILLPGAAMLSPRGGVLENGMPRFFRRHAEGVLDVPDLHRRTDDLASFIQAASTAYKFDAQRVIAVGFSNGANIAGSMLLRRPEMLAGAVLLHPMVPFEPEQFPDLAGKPIFIGAGRRDPLVPVSNTQRLIEIFKQARANVTESWANGGHTITHEELRGAQAWIKSLPFVAQAR